MATASYGTVGSTTANTRAAEMTTFRILQTAFVLAPVIAGIDKFTDILVNWDMYACPLLGQIFGQHVHAFMMVVGVIEIVAGLGVAIRPKYFAYVVACWLAGIIINLLLCGTFFDIALRDFGLCLCAIALGRLAQAFDHGSFASRSA